MDFNLQHGIRMVVTPRPVRLLIFVFHLGKFYVLTMILLRPHTVRLILVAAPFVVVIVFFVVITTLIFSPQRAVGATVIGTTRAPPR